MTSYIKRAKYAFRQFKRGFIEKHLLFLNDQSGLSAVMVGLSLIPILLGIGMAFDTTRAHYLRSELSSAVDAAALAGGRVFFAETRDQDIQNYFTINFPDGLLDSTVDSLDIVENQASGSVTVSATATMPTVFMRLVGVDEITVSASGTATRRSVPLDVVLAVDVSCSMWLPIDNTDGCPNSEDSNSRLDAAKTAAQQLTNILYGTPPSPFVRVAVVPWAGKVNVTDDGTVYGFDSDGNPLPFPSDPATDNGNDNTAWQAVATSGYYPNPYRQEKYTFSYHEDKSRGRPTPLKIASDTRPYSSGSDWQDIWQRFILNEKSDASPGYYQDTVAKIFYAHNSPVPLFSPPNPGWTGCVYSRYAYNGDPAKYRADGSYDDSDDEDNDRARQNAADIYDTPIENVGPDNLDWIAWMPMGYEGDPRSGGECDASHIVSSSNECTPCPSVGITRLTTSQPAVNTAINRLAAGRVNYTNIPEGLAWAWRVLSPEAPYTESSQVISGSDPNRRQKAIVLLTDGRNTRSPGDAYNASVYNRDNRLELIAGKIKDEDIFIYVIQFANDDSNLRTLLKGVASEPNEPFYFNAPTADELNQVFRTVATNLAELRLSQ